jgi:hypothetical protein
MPDGEYKVLEIAHAPDGPLYHIARQPAAVGNTLHIEDWRLHHPKEWPPVVKRTSVLFEVDTDHLALCELGVCLPNVKWLRRDKYDRWVVESEDSSICVVQ